MTRPDRPDRQEPAPRPPSPAREEEERRARARAELGIEKLGAGEELIDVDTFSQIQDELTVRGNVSADASAGSAAEELLLEEIASELPADLPRDECRGDTLAAPADPGEVAGIEAMLNAACDREQVADAATRLGSAHVRAFGLFVVNRGVIAGLRAAGDGLDERIGGVVVSLEASLLFADPALSARPFYGPAPQDGVDGRILRALGRADVAEILLLPVSIRGRVVNLLYADNGRDPIPRTSIGALRSLVDLVANAYEGLILSRKAEQGRER